MDHAPGEVTQLLLGLKAGASGRRQLLDVGHVELHRMAGRYMRQERSDHTLQAPALTHEAYFHLIDQRAWPNRARFFGVAAQVMRRIRLEHVRTRGTA